MLRANAVAPVERMASRSSTVRLPEPSFPSRSSTAAGVPVRLFKSRPPSLLMNLSKRCWKEMEEMATE